VSEDVKIAPGTVCYSLPTRKGYMLQVKHRGEWIDALPSLVENYADVLYFDTSHESMRLVRRSIEDVVLL
jgi:hypothetical protein